MSRIKDLTGEKFNKLTVIKLDYERNKSQDTSKKKRIYWLCKCDCGNPT